MKNIAIALLAMGLSALAQSPSTTGTSAPVQQHISAMVTVSEVVTSGSLAAVIATIPPSTTLPDGTTVTLRGYQVLVSGSLDRLMVQYAH
jgi:uncharacterized protein YdeI (BOF family)